MPNWCFTEITMVGSKENVNKLHNDMTTLLAKNRKGSSEEMWSFLNDNNWLGYVAEELLGVHRDKISCRGTLDRIDGPWQDSGDKWRVDMTWCSAWAPCYHLQKLLAQRYKLQLYFIAEEAGCGLYETNDAAGEYYSPYYWEGDGYSTYEELVADYREVYGGEVKDLAHLRQLIAQLNQDLQCYEIVNDFGAKIENTTPRIDWKAYKQHLRAAIKNEELWAMGSDKEVHDMHTENVANLQEELDAVERGDYEPVIQLHGKEFFEEFLLKE